MTKENIVKKILLEKKVISDTCVNGMCSDIISHIKNGFYLFYIVENTMIAMANSKYIELINNKPYIVYSSKIKYDYAEFIKIDNEVIRQYTIIDILK